MIYKNLFEYTSQDGGRRVVVAARVRHLTEDSVISRGTRTIIHLGEREVLFAREDMQTIAKRLDAALDNKKENAL